MKTLLEVVGALFLAGIGMLLITMGVATVWWLYERSCRRAERAIRQSEAVRIANDLYNASFWFGENPPTARAFRIVSDSVARTGTWRDDAVREEWRRSLAPAEEDANGK